MNERNQGSVVPFGLSSSRLRRSAAEHRRQGRPVDALELTRRAAQREDTTALWLEVAEGLSGLACYEEAAAVVYRMLSREDVTLDAWMLLARCQRALGRREGAIDSLYHYLSADPFSDTADAARGMLADLEDASAEHDAYRLPRLIGRGLRAWRAGDRELGLRRLHRAVKMSADPARLHITIALLMLAEKDSAGAIRELAAALKKAPDQPRALTAMCVGLCGLGKRRMAMGLLQKCEKLCTGPENEELFLTAAWTLDAKKAQQRYLETALRSTPCRLTLMYPLSVLYYEQGRVEQAKKLWHRMLRIDPGQQRARICLDWTEKHPGEGLPAGGTLPRSEVQRRMMLLARSAAAGMPCHELLTPGSQTRMVADWCFTLGDEGLQTAVLGAVSREQHPVVIAYLKELLTCQSVGQNVREKALLRLEEMGVEGPLPMLMGNQMTMARSTAREKQHSRWATFLRLLLEETADHGQTMPIVYYAADEWRQMDKRRHRLAAGPDSYSYVKAIEILYLRETGQEEAAFEVVRRMDTTRRRVERVLRGLAPHHELLKGED